MDLNVIRVIDAILDGNDKPPTRLYVPTVLKRADIESVSPNLTQKGKLYKNLSLFKTYSGDNHIVVGNYRELSKIVKDKYISKQIGYR